MSACFTLRMLGAAVVFCAAVAPARADTVFIGDSELPGLFSGNVSVTDQTTTSAVITVQLTNISPATNGGYITGLAFNNPGTASNGNINNVTSFTPSYAPPTDQSFQLIGGPTFTNTVSASPYGAFDIGAAVGVNWLGSGAGGGSPQDGLAVGETGTFVFNVTGTDLNNLSAANLMAAMSDNGTAGFVVRFRGFEDGTSDKDVASVIRPPPVGPFGVVPAPPGLVLAGMGFGCVLLGRLRFRRK